MLRMVELLPGKFINLDEIVSIEFTELPKTKRYMGGDRVVVHLTNKNAQFTMDLSNTKEALQGEEARQWRDVAKAFGILRAITKNATHENPN